MRELGDETRGEALAGISPEQREQLMNMLSVMKINLLHACRTAVNDDEVNNG
jgi:MarR family transcriptional regulator for hemolysin